MWGFMLRILSVFSVVMAGCVCGLVHAAAAPAAGSIVGPVAAVSEVAAVAPASSSNFTGMTIGFGITDIIQKQKVSMNCAQNAELTTGANKLAGVDAKLPMYSFNLAGNGTLPSNFFGIFIPIGYGYEFKNHFYLGGEATFEFKFGGNATNKFISTSPIFNAAADAANPSEDPDSPAADDWRCNGGADNGNASLNLKTSSNAFFWTVGLRLGYVVKEKTLLFMGIGMQWIRPLRYSTSFINDDTLNSYAGAGNFSTLDDNADPVENTTINGNFNPPNLPNHNLLALMLKFGIEYSFAKNCIGTFDFSFGLAASGGKTNNANGTMPALKAGESYDHTGEAWIDRKSVV